MLGVFSFLGAILCGGVYCGRTVVGNSRAYAAHMAKFGPLNPEQTKIWYELLNKYPYFVPKDLPGRSEESLKDTARTWLRESKERGISPGQCREILVEKYCNERGVKFIKGYSVKDWGATYWKLP